MIEQRDTDAGGQMNRPVREHRHAPVEAFDDLVGDDFGPVSPRPRKQNREFVATDSAQDVGLPQTLLQGAGHGFEQVVARCVAKRVVDILEMVDINQQHRSRMAVAPRAFGLLCELLLEASPVEETGQHSRDRPGTRGVPPALSARKYPAPA